MPLSRALRQLSFATSVAAALSIGGCGSRTPQAACADRAGVRLPDSDCYSGRGGAHWYYGGSAGRTAVGQRLKGGSFTAPSRGGFGTSARGGSGG